MRAVFEKSIEAVGKITCRDLGKTGSGFFLGSQGFLLTNNHVVSRMNIDTTGAIRLDYSNQISVKVGERIYEASLAMDKNSDRPVVYDYAVLKLDITPKAYFEIVDASVVAQGDEVIAIGYPLEFNEPVLTDGVISAIVSRPSHINSLHRIKTFLTNTIVIYGNSGGPLIRKSDGKVVGIITMPHEMRDEVRQRLKTYINSRETEIPPPIRDLIKFVLKYIQIGLVHAVSIEYAINDPIFNLNKGGS